MCACASATNDSRKMPRRDAGLVGDDHDTANPARFSSRTASTVNGKNDEPLEPIEIARLFDERAVAIEEDGAASCRPSRGARATLADDRRRRVMPFMQR